MSVALRAWDETTSGEITLEIELNSPPKNVIRLATQYPSWTSF